MVKYCTGCGVTKDTSEFHKSKAQKDGLVSQCKNCKSSYRKKYYNRNRKSLIKDSIDWQKSNKERRKKYYKKYAKNNAEKIKTYQQEYSKKNRAKLNKYSVDRRANNIQAKIAHNLRTRINKYLNGFYKKHSSIESLGCSIQELQKHLEEQFKPGMSWCNYGAWHIDHVKPLNKFNLKNEKDLKKACHYSNLQPLWASENLSKKDSYGEGSE